LVMVKLPGGEKKREGLGTTRSRRACQKIKLIRGPGMFAWEGVEKGEKSIPRFMRSKGLTKERGLGSCTKKIWTLGPAEGG